MVAGPARPRWLAHAASHHAIEWMPKEKVVYVALNAIADPDSGGLYDVGVAIREAVRTRKATGLVLDLRLNNGGNGELIPMLMRSLVDLAVVQEEGAFQVLTGPRAFSAAMTLLGELARYTEMETVGWPTGGRPVHIGTETPFRLPMSGLMGSTSARLEVAGRSSVDARPTFAPTLNVWPTGAELAKGADPVLDAALAAIAARPK
jgi:hypothetical protein